VEAWRLTAPGGALALRDVDVPEVTENSVLVRLEAAPLLSYLRSYTAGELTSYHPPHGEFTPGTDGIGRVEAVGPGVFGLTAGQRVYCSPHLVVSENVPAPAEALIGLTAEPDSAPLLDRWRDGTLAELTLAPAAAVTPVPAGLDNQDGARLAALSRCVVPYGGLLRARLAPGETVVIHGATGAYGSAAVLVAIALGASHVVAAGRNRDALERLGALPRVIPVAMTGDAAADTRALRDAAGTPDCALDMVGRANSADGTLATLHALGRGGRLVLMGSMTVPLPVDYARSCGPAGRSWATSCTSATRPGGCCSWRPAASSRLTASRSTSCRWPSCPRRCAARSSPGRRWSSSPTSSQACRSPKLPLASQRYRPPEARFPAS
jgi:alcohol dehydrogenase